MVNDNYSHWKRRRPLDSRYKVATLHTFKKMFDDNLINSNIDLDIHSKRIALKVSGSVVSIVAKIGNERVFATSGVIVDCEEIVNSNNFLSTIVTSASLLRTSPNKNEVRENLKLKVLLSCGRTVMAEPMKYDFHYNIATLQIHTAERLPVAKLNAMDDSASLVEDENATETHSFALRRHSDRARVTPGDPVLALGRFYKKPYHLMLAPGKLSADCCDFDCKEVFSANCIISKAGTGGPLVNSNGEVIGINFYKWPTTPFLPANIVIKCLEQFKNFGKLCPPHLGVEMSNLYSANLGMLDAFAIKFPNVWNGVFVEKVVRGSASHIVGIQPGDVIIQCNEKVIRGLLQFFDELWENVGKNVELVVLRESCGAQLNISILVGNPTPKKINRWPIPKKQSLFVSGLRMIDR